MPPQRMSMFSIRGIKEIILNSVALFFQRKDTFSNPTMEWLRTYNTSQKEKLLEKRVAWVKAVFPTDTKNTENESISSIALTLETEHTIQLTSLSDVMIGEHLGTLIDLCKNSPTNKPNLELAKEFITQTTEKTQNHFFVSIFEDTVKDPIVQEYIVSFLYCGGGELIKGYELLKSVAQSVIKGVFRGWIGVEVAASVLAWIFTKITDIGMPGHIATPLKSIIRTLMRNGYYNDSNDGINGAIHSLLKSVLIDILTCFMKSPILWGVIGSVTAMYMMLNEKKKHYKDYFEPLLVCAIGLTYLYWDSIRPLALKLLA